MKTLVLGSCRVHRACYHLTNITRYEAGNVHSLGQCIQAAQTIRGDFKIPFKARFEFINHSIRKNRKKVISNLQKNKITNLFEVNKIILEVSSIHNRYNIVKGKREYLWRNNTGKKQPHLKEVDNLETLQQKLHFFCSFFPNAKILFVPIHLRINRPDRKLIPITLSQFANKNQHDYFDPYGIIKKYGQKKCLIENKNNHYTEFMISKVKNRILTFINYKSSSSVSES